MHLLRNLLFALSLSTCTCHAELVTLAIGNSGPNASSVNIFVDASILGDDEVTSSISGEITLDLLPSAINPTSAQIVSFNAIVDDEVDFRVGRFPLPTVTIEADPATIELSMFEPGIQGQITADTFSQFENLVGLGGVVSASVAPDPIDLGEQAPTWVDFEDVGIAFDRSSVTLSSSLFAEQSIPFEVGFLEIDVVLEVDGTIEAAGAMPPARYSITPPVEVVTPFAATQHWRRGGVADTNSLPTSIDSVVFEGIAENAGTIDLSATTQSVTNANVTAGRVELQNGTLDVTEALILEENAVLFLHPNTNLVASSMNLEPESVLVTTSTSTHMIEGELTFDGKLSVFPPEVPGSFDLFTFGAFTGSFTDVPPTHVEDGRFASITVGDNAIQLVYTQALAGDTDGNGLVEFADFLQLSSVFGMAGDWPLGDFDGNEMIEFADFLALSSNFGKSVAAAKGIASVPESNSCISSVLYFLILFRHRWRRSLTGRRIS